MRYAPPQLPFKTPHIMDGDLPTVVTQAALLYPYSESEVMVIRRRGGIETGRRMTNAAARKILQALDVPPAIEQVRILKEWNNAR